MLCIIGFPQHGWVWLNLNFKYFNLISTKLKTSTYYHKTMTKVYKYKTTFKPFQSHLIGYLKGKKIQTNYIYLYINYISIENDLFAFKCMPECQFFFFLVLGPSDAQGLFLALCSEIASEGPGR